MSNWFTYFIALPYLISVMCNLYYYNTHLNTDEKLNKDMRVIAPERREFMKQFIIWMPLFNTIITGLIFMMMFAHIFFAVRFWCSELYYQFKFYLLKRKVRKNITSKLRRMGFGEMADDFEKEIFK